MIVFVELFDVHNNTFQRPEGVCMWLWWIGHKVDCLLGQCFEYMGSCAGKTLLSSIYPQSSQA
jgi:hypothetical protein